MGQIATLAMDKTITEEQMGPIQNYVSLNLKSKDYLFRWKLYKILIKELSKEQRKEIDLSRFSHKLYKETYLGAKRELDLFKKSTLNFDTSDVEEFIKSYKKNAKSKS